MRYLKTLLSLLCLLGAAGAARADSAPIASPRDRLLLDFGWKFHLGDDWGPGYLLTKAGTGIGPASTNFSDASWRSVDLPHDWAVELPFDPKADISHGFKPVGPGFPQNNVGWYRRTFALPKADAGRRIWLEFDGVFRDSTVFVNGWFVGRQPSGYSSFRYDITDIAQCGEPNVVTVRVDVSQLEGWFYEGAGIYRHVWLVKTSPLAIAPDGVGVASRFAGDPTAGPAEIDLQARIQNDGPAAAGTATWEILAPDGRTLATASQPFQAAAAGTVDLSARTQVDVPELWSPETPRLYTLVTRIQSGGVAVDQVKTHFGIRTVGFDPNRGFLLNGRPYELKGTCNHQDHAGVGAALPDALQDFRIARLKEMGSNAYRTSHNAPTPELLDACDRLGMLVMDENRLLGSDAANLERLDNQIRRDRNHASVAIWSIANEEFAVQGTAAAGRVATTMQAHIRRIDPTRPITYAAPVGDEFVGINAVIEVRGWNYHVGSGMDDYHREHPLQPNVGTEQASTVGTRGIYANDPVRGYVTAYDDSAPSWAQTAETWWTYFDARPWLSGGFAWTGFDYRGEPTPYAWPCISSHFGIMDTCGFPKDNYFYYQSWWTAAPVLHLMPHWNWAGREGQVIDVRALSNCDAVELSLNGRDLGRQTLARDSVARWKVPYAPGVLSARGYRGGQLVAETKVETTGAPAALRLTPDRTTIGADGRDVSVITVAVVDAQGRVVPTAGTAVQFDLAGPGRIIGVGNGDPSCHEPDVYVRGSVARCIPINAWRWTKIDDPYADKRPETGVQFDDSAWATADATAESGPFGPSDKGVMRTHFTVAPADLSAAVVELTFGKIEGGLTVFVNGVKVGPAGDARGPSVYDVKALLHPGENTAAVIIANYGVAAGVNRGVNLRLQDPAPAPQWSRSVFNGLGQIIVQGSRTSGALALTAAAAALAPATATIQTQAVALAPAVP